MSHAVTSSPVRDQRPEVVDQFAAHVLWMAEDPMLPGRSYLMRIGTNIVPARITSLKHKVDVNTLEHIAAKTLGSERDRPVQPLARRAGGASIPTATTATPARSFSSIASPTPPPAPA